MSCHDCVNITAQRERHEQDAPDQERQSVLEELLEALDVGRQPGDDPAGRFPGEVVEVESVQVSEQTATEVGEVPLGEPAHRPLLEVRAADLGGDEARP